MVEVAGGDCVPVTAGQRSVRVTLDDLAASRPDLVVVAPCGCDRDRGAVLEHLPARVCVHTDANAMWAGPCRALAYGIEELADVIRDWRQGAPGAAQALP